MARPSRRCYLVLSLCLLFQQFAPAFTNHVHKHSIPYSEWSDVDDNAVDKEEDESGETRGVIFELVKLIGKPVLKTITFGSYGIAFTATVVQAVLGCSASFPSIKTDFDEFKKLQKEYDETKTKIRDESRQAMNREIYTNDSYNAYQETRKQMLRISDEATLVLKSMGPEVASILVNVSDDMERVMEKYNQTNQAADLLQVNDKFAEGLELGMRLTFTGLALAVPGIKNLWRKHLKKTFIGKKIQQFATKFKTRFVTPGTAKAKQTFSKIMSRGFLGKAKAAITARLNKIVSRVGPKFAKLSGVFAKVKTGIKGLVKLGGAALAVWTAVETFDNCRKKRDEAKQSVKEMKTHVQDIKKYLQDVTNMNGDVQKAWEDVRNFTLATEMLEALKTLKEMILDKFTLRDEQEQMDVANKIQNYIDATALDPSSEESKTELNNRQRAMNDILGVITVTLNCFKYKGIAFGNVQEFCALGDSPFSKIYQDSTKESSMDPRLQCKRRTGQEYISEEAMKTAWVEWVNSNKTVNATCLMNNPGIVEQILDLMREGKTDPEEITNAVIRTPSKREASKPEIAEIIKKIKEDNPDIENQLPSDMVGYICAGKKDGLSAAEIVKQLDFIAKFKLGRSLTVQEVENVPC